MSVDLIGVIEALEMSPWAQDNNLAARIRAEGIAPANGEQVFGIIDPDYARIFTQARILAWQYGYACLAHGTFTRDLDLLLVPWADNVIAEPEHIINRLADAAGLRVKGPFTDKPHGRKTWTLLFTTFGDPRWVDVSAVVADAVAGGDARKDIFIKRQPQPWHETELKAVEDKAYCEGWNDCIDSYLDLENHPNPGISP